MHSDQYVTRRDLLTNIPHGEMAIYQAALREYRKYEKSAPLEIGPGTNGCSQAVYLLGPRCDLGKFWEILSQKDKMPRIPVAGHITNIHPDQLRRFVKVLAEYLITPNCGKLKIGPGIDSYEHALYWDGPEKNINLFWEMYAPKWIEAGATKKRSRKK